MPRASGWQAGSPCPPAVQAVRAGRRLPAPPLLRPPAAGRPGGGADSGRPPPPPSPPAPPLSPPTHPARRHSNLHRGKRRRWQMAAEPARLWIMKPVNGSRGDGIRLVGGGVDPAVEASGPVPAPLCSLCLLLAPASPRPPLALLCSPPCSSVPSPALPLSPLLLRLPPALSSPPPPLHPCLLCTPSVWTAAPPCLTVWHVV